MLLLLPPAIPDIQDAIVDALMEEATNKRLRDLQQQPTTPIPAAAPVSALEQQLLATVKAQQAQLELMQSQFQTLMAQVTNSTLPAVPASDAGVSEVFPPPPAQPIPQMVPPPLDTAPQEDWLTQL